MTDRVTRPRRIALAVLREVRDGNLADRALDALGSELDARDFAWTQELVYGVFRLRGRIDFLLGRLVRGGTSELEPDVLDILRLGAYQLLEMGSVPPYAAISQSVELARWAGVHRAAGLVNGVLHSLDRRRGEIAYPDRERDPISFLAAWGSHPRWLVERWVARWGVAEVTSLVESNNRKPELYLRLLGQSPQEAIQQLAREGVDAEPVEFSRHSIRILPPATARQVLGVLPAVVQDPAAALVVEHAAVPSDSMVVDLCAAPGGKAVATAMTARYVCAADVSPGRLRRLRENVERVGLRSRMGLVVADARRPPFRQGDVVLLDAPCTGTGTLRRHPDGRWRVAPQDLRSLGSLQRELLDAAAALVRPFGLLVYSTCSLEPEENEEQVTAFLHRHPEFTRANAADVDDPALRNDRGDLMVLPQRFGVDGAYAARLRRAA